MNENLLAVDIRSVTLTESSALISIPAANSVFDEGCSDELCAQIKVEDEGDQLRVEAVIDKPDDDEITKEQISE